jgi:sarcosine oxidase subunit delta
MKTLCCPMNGPRNISEFAWGGEVVAMPDPVTGSDRDWAEYLFMENNTRGVVREWWMHVPTSYWFIVERNTETDEVLRTYPATELFGTRMHFQAPEPRT